MTADTTAPSYWLNWRFLLCAIWIFIAMVFAALTIWRYEGNNKSRNRPNGNQLEAKGCLHKGDSWGTCSKSIHPVWLLAYRIVAFCVLLTLITAEAFVHGVIIFFFYTQWTFTLLTIYFGLGSSLSIHGYLHKGQESDLETDRCVGTDVERGSYVAPTLGENAEIPSINRSLNHHDDLNSRTPSAWEYALQIIFQICAGAVVLTDCVYWLVLYPILISNNYRLGFLNVCMHSVNVVFLLGEVTLNRLRFPFFRVAYFILWTCIFVIFQWIVHAFVSVRWPYPFLDLSSQYAPIWYLSVGLLHFPFFGIFYLIFKIKQRCLSR